MLKIQFKDRRKPAIWLVDSTFLIGSNSGCDITIEEDGVAPQHAELTINQDDILLKNISENRSVFINDIPVIKEQALNAWDVIRLGGTELEIIDPLSERSQPPKAQQEPEQQTIIRAAVSPWMLKANSAPLDGQYFSLTDGAILGRDKSSEVVVPLSYISRQHAKFAIRNERLYVDDLNSSNGTFVNGEKIKSCELFNGDELRLDEFIFNLIGPENKNNKKPRTIVRAKDDKKPKSAKNATKSKTKNNSQAKVSSNSEASKKVFMHGLSHRIEGKVIEITQSHNHLSRMLGHHLSTSEQSVSARHVYLQETPLGWEIKNDGASDGLMVNGKMQAKAILQDGDELIVGGTLLKFQSTGDKPLSYRKPQPKKSSGNGLLIMGILVLGIVVAGAVAFGFI